MAAKYKKNLFTIFGLVLLGSMSGITAFTFVDDELYFNSKCISIRNGLSESGICVPMAKCPELVAQLMVKNYNFTVCGYEGFSQIVCCPSQLNTRLGISNHRLTLNETVDCIVGGTGEKGVIKFRSECKILANTTLPNENICEHEVCNDLVCCPTTVNARLKQICSHVDMPSNEITIRLHLNLPCGVKDTNLTGRYQRECDYAKRNPHMVEQLRNICNDDSCNGWYCCPIEEPSDLYQCENKIPLPNVKIVGPKCIDARNGRTGRCRSIDDCIGYAKNELNVCGNHCCLNYYCCPDAIPDVTTQPISVQKCFEYSNFVNKYEIEVKLNFYGNGTECGLGNQPVVGEEIQPGKYPHMAALGYELDGDTTWQCSGSLISDQFVLSAAHCLVKNSKYGELKLVQLGVVNLYNDIGVQDCPEIYKVFRTIPHPDYNTKLDYSDIGLIQLDRRISFNYHIRPICLPSTSNFPNHFESMGWRETKFPYQLRSDKINKVNPVLLRYEQCQQFYEINQNFRLNRGIDNGTQICASVPYDEFGTCAVDSGSPLIANHPKMDRVYEIYGVASTGVSCGPIYTQVYPYKQWIESIVFPAY